MGMDKMIDVVCDEIDKIANKGLSTSNLETAYKLVDMYKDLKTVQAMEDSEYGEYSNNSYSMRGYDDNGSSYARGRGRNARRDSMGRYSRDGMGYSDAYDRYSQAKYEYRHSRDDGAKQMIMESLDGYMDDMTRKLEDMMQDADTAEEKQTIQRYVQKLKSLK